MDGKDDFILTGQLGDVMKESARAGLSLRPGAHRRSWASTRDVFEKQHPPHPRAGRRNPEGRPVGRRHDGHRHGEPAHRRSRPARTWR